MQKWAPCLFYRLSLENLTATVPSLSATASIVNFAESTTKRQACETLLSLGQFDVGRPSLTGGAPFQGVGSWTE